MTDLQAIAKLTAKDGDTVGFRFVDHAVSVGDTLEASFAWDGDVKTDSELAGTCAFTTWRAAEKYAQYSRGIGGSMIVIKGRFAGYGDDMVDEVLIADAEVIAVIEW